MEPLKFESQSVQSHLSILQAVIGRMASNSTSCKTWCVTLVSAVVVVIAGQREPRYVWIALIPVVLFLLLDAYYLGLERAFRDVYNNFIKKVHEGTACIEDVYIISPVSRARDIAFCVADSLKSLSIWSFYGMIVVMLVIARFVILPASSFTGF